MNDITRNNHGGNPESEAANQSIADVKEIVRRQVEEFVDTRGDDGATADEAAIIFGSSHNHVAPRMTELLADGRLIDSGRRRPTRSGRSARVLVTPRFAAKAAGAAA